MSATRGEATVDVVVVSFNSRGHLRACVEPLAGLDDIHVIVVDNASTELVSWADEDGNASTAASVPGACACATTPFACAQRLAAVRFDTWSFR